MSGEQIQGLIFDIHRFSIHDGPGIRTTVFLKGCPLACWWCHNPESISPEIEPNLTKPGTVFGRRVSVEEVMETVLRDRAFYENSGGGITISGGEPMLQFEFTLALLKEARRKGIHTCLDTSGWGGVEAFTELLPLVDLFHFDYKATDPNGHKEWTGVPLEPIVSNLRKLAQQGANVVLRCPIVPTLNDTESHFRGIQGFMEEMPTLQVEILPFHNMAREKWRRVGRENLLSHLANPDRQMKVDWHRQLLDLGCDPNRLVMA